MEDEFKRFTNSTPEREKAEHMTICMRMLAPEWEFSTSMALTYPVGWWGSYCKRAQCSCYVPIDYLRMEISPIFIMGLDNYRRRGWR